MDLSGEEQATLAAIETALGEEDPELARTLATFTRPHRSRRWLWLVLVVSLILVSLSLGLGLVLHSTVLNILGAVLVGAVLATIAVLSWDALSR